MSHHKRIWIRVPVINHRHLGSGCALKRKVPVCGTTNTNTTLRLFFLYLFVSIFEVHFFTNVWTWCRWHGASFVLYQNLQFTKKQLQYYTFKINIRYPTDVQQRMQAPRPHLQNSSCGVRLGHLDTGTSGRLRPCLCPWWLLVKMISRVPHSHRASSGRGCEADPRGVNLIRGIIAWCRHWREADRFPTCCIKLFGCDLCGGQGCLCGCSRISCRSTRMSGKQFSRLPVLGRQSNLKHT